MTARKRVPRKTPPGTKPKPRKLSEADLAERQRFAAKQATLERTAQELTQAQAELVGAWTYWRESVINSRDQMTAEDQIEDDGTIVRA